MSKAFDKLMATTAKKSVKDLKKEGTDLYEIKLARENNILEGVKNKVIKSDALIAEAKAIRKERAAAKAAKKQKKEKKK